MAEGKIIVISAPSGTGKSTIINAILDSGEIDMRFSVSATNRQPREGEVNGINYHFITTEEFRQRIDADGFIEWEEVYEGRYYGTPRSEIERVCGQGHNIILDIDVKGALNVKREYGDNAITIFIEPPSIEALAQRLANRGTETPESLKQRIDKAEYEMGFANQFDKIVINDDLQQAIECTKQIIANFVNSEC